MSSGKKKFPKKRTYSEGDVKRLLKECSDETVAKTLLLCLVAARDKFKLDADGVVDFMEVMSRYVKYEKQGLVNMNDASESLEKETGIELRLRKW